jgi:methyl-accepting chemotaxis protein
VQEITAASEEQSSGVGQINAAVNQLSQTTQQNASSSEELAATAEEMSNHAEQLRQTMGFFKIGSSDVVERSERTRVRPPSLPARGAARRVSRPKVASAAAVAVAGEPDESQFGRF